MFCVYVIIDISILRRVKERLYYSIEIVLYGDSFDAVVSYSPFSYYFYSINYSPFPLIFVIEGVTGVWILDGVLGVLLYYGSLYVCGVVNVTD